MGCKKIRRLSLKRMEEIKSRRIVHPNDFCKRSNHGSLQLSSRVEMWGPSTVFYFTAVSTHDVFFIRDIQLVMVGTPVAPILIDINAYVGDSRLSGRSEVAHKRLRLTYRLPANVDELTSVAVTVSATRLQSGVNATHTPSVFENRKLPVAAVDDYVTPFGRRSLPVSF